MAGIDVVVKVGGGLLAHPDEFSSVLAAISRLSESRRTLIVPGGGPFAEAVREAARRFRLPDDAAHWMAILAMDQCAYLVSSKADNAAVVTSIEEIANLKGRLPVLAPMQWLRRVDPLPHSWDVTSDSIAAWVAGEVRARHLVLIKPPGARTSDDGVVDSYFARALPAGMVPLILTPERAEMLESLVSGS